MSTHFANWRATALSSGYYFIEIKATDGVYFSPDCTYECEHCGECLGCIRKFVPYGDMHGLFPDEDHTTCQHSPTGFHETER